MDKETNLKRSCEEILSMIMCLELYQIEFVLDKTSPGNCLKKETYLLQKIIYLTAGIISISLIIRFALVFFSQPYADLLTWDQAARAEDVVRLTKELYHFQIHTFIIHILSLNWWPPLSYLIILPFSIILGASFRAMIIPSFIAFPSAVLAILFLYKNLSRESSEEKLVGFSFIFALAITSPFLLSSASWVMTEIFGILLTYLAFGFYFKARQYNHVSSYKICALIIFLLWTLKYNYGLFSMLVIFVFEIARSRNLIQNRIFSKTVRFLIKPILYPAYVILFLIVIITLTKGTRINLFGLGLSITNIYNPIMFLYLYLLVVIIVISKKNWSRIKEQLERGQKEILLWGVLPTGIFLTLPDKIKGVIRHFKAGREVDAQFSLEQVIYYFRSFCTDYSLFLPVGIVVLVLLFVGLVKIKRTPLGIKFLMLFFLFGYLSMSLSFNLKESRYIATFIPALWVISAWTADSLTKKLSKKIKTGIAIILTISAVAVTQFSPIIVNKAIRQPWAPWAHHPTFVREYIDTIIKTTNDAQNIVIFGANDLGLGPLLAWKLQTAHIKQKNFKLELLDFDEENRGSLSFEEALHKPEIDMIVFFIVKMGNMETHLMEWTRKLEQLETYKLVERTSFTDPVTVRILFFRKFGK